MRVTVVREPAAGERRVAAVPETVGKLRAAGYEVVVEAGAGAGALVSDEAFRDAGAEVAPDRAALLGRAELWLTVGPPTPADAGTLAPNATLIGFCPPSATVEALRVLAERNATVFALDLVPRLSRAQSMDGLSSQALVGGYRAALVAATRLPKFLPMFMTAAGTVPPARVLVLGAGVAGLQAIATARRLGAVVEAYDVRPAAGEEVRSLGGTFLELPLESQEGSGGYARVQSDEFLAHQRELLTDRVAAADAVITTAAVPGRPAPVLVTTAMVEGMRPGGVVVDLAAESGGNCELTRAGEEVEHGGVLIIGLSGAASQIPVHASALLARNLLNLVVLMTREGRFDPDFADEIVSGCCVLRAGEPVHPAAVEVLSGEGAR